MRRPVAALSTLCLLLLMPAAFLPAAQGQETPPPPPGGETPPPAPPAERPAFRMADGERKTFEKLLDEYLNPGKKPVQEILERFEKFVAKPVGGRSVLEDVAGISEIAERLRGANPKAVKSKGKVVEEDLRPDVHGFPGGVGTVKYFLYVPKDYSPQKPLPLIFCLPDNNAWPEGSSYLEEMWLKRSEKIGAGFILAAPRPHARGDPWTSPKSLARAMITLRHVCGVYESNKKDAGPAVDLRRVFIDGEEAAALVAARMPEIFCGAILHRVTGGIEGQPRIRDSGFLNGLASYFVCEPGNADQAQFAQRAKTANDACAIEEAPAGGVLGNIEEIAKWIEGLPRVTQPRRIEFTVHDSSFQRHFWINVLEFDAAAKPAASIAAEADAAGNVVKVTSQGVSRFELFLNDALVDLSRELRIVVVDGGKELELFRGKPERSLPTMLEELVASNHSWRIYPVRFVADVAALRRLQAEREAAAAAGSEVGGSSGGKPGGKASAGP